MTMRHEASPHPLTHGHQQSGSGNTASGTAALMPDWPARAVRGMHDLLPGAASRRRTLEQRIITVLDRYGYREIRFPVVEHSAVFSGMGESSDVVQKQMYAFADRGGTQLSLRPEGTAGCVRAGIEHGLFRSSEPQRLWYLGPMFRHERPQQGRLRQFDQIGVETYGLAGPDIDAELLLIGNRIWEQLELPPLELELNTLGTPEDRARYRQQLQSYFLASADQLCKLDRERLQRNPLRLLDSKDATTVALCQDAPDIVDSLCTESREHFAALCALLQQCGVVFRVNRRLVRGLDYYTATVFEWLLPGQGAQNAICAGGRYDLLVEGMGGPQVPAIGFALGLERIAGLRTETTPAEHPHAYLVIAGDPAPGMALAETVRSHLPWLRLLVHCGGGNLKRQLRRADRSGADYALILGATEYADATIALKSLRTDQPQQHLPWQELATHLARLYGRALADSPADD